MIVDGYIASVKDYGCIVNFYGNARGLVPLNELSAQKVTSPASLFKVGQVVKCRVLSVNPSQNKMVLSFLLTPKDTPIEGDTSSPFALIKSGQVSSSDYNKRISRRLMQLLLSWLVERLHQLEIAELISRSMESKAIWRSTR